jgi:hypothetical protein
MKTMLDRISTQTASLKGGSWLDFKYAAQRNPLAVQALPYKAFSGIGTARKETLYFDSLNTPRPLQSIESPGPMGLEIPKFNESRNKVSPRLPQSKTLLQIPLIDDRIQDQIISNHKKKLRISLQEPIARLRNVTLELIRVLINRNDVGSPPTIKRHQVDDVTESVPIQPFNSIDVLRKMMIVDNHQSDGHWDVHSSKKSSKIGETRVELYLITYLSRYRGLIPNFPQLEKDFIRA